jgi:type VI secretion system protein ImpK
MEPMQEELANLVYPVISRALDLKDRLARGELAHLDAEQAALKGLLLTELEARRWVDFGGEEERAPSRAVRPHGTEEQPERPATFLGARYALVCWLDELFIVHSVWGEEWNERKLEVALYGSNERAWKFWEQARLAETRPTTDALEAFFLAVTLGFRGELRDQHERLRAWVVANQARLTRVGPDDWPHPPELDPPVNVPPLRGRDRLGRAFYFGGLALLVVLPIVVFSLVQRLGQ